MASLTRKTADDKIVAQKPIEELTREDIQALINKLYSFEAVVEYWERNS